MIKKLVDEFRDLRSNDICCIATVITILNIAALIFNIAIAYSINH